LFGLTGTSNQFMVLFLSKVPGQFASPTWGTSQGPAGHMPQPADGSPTNVGGPHERSHPPLAPGVAPSNLSTRIGCACFTWYCRCKGSVCRVLILSLATNTRVRFACL
jgi:hypothetical protein